MPPSRTYQNIKPSDRSITFLIFCLLMVFYLITFTGVIQSSDGLAMFATTENLVRRGAIDSNQIIWMENQQGNFGSDGNLYSRKGLGMTLLAYPLVWLARLFNGIGLVHTALLLNPIITALTGALLYRAGRRLGWMPATAALVSLTFGLATLAWPYTQTYFSDPICAFGLFGAFYGLLSYAQAGRKRYLFWAGIAWGIAYLTRVANLVTLPLYLLGLYVAVLHYSGLASRRRRSWGVHLSLLLRRYWRPFVAFLVPVVLAGLLSLWWNWIRFDSIWDSGYVESERFSAIWWQGITGLLVGPARGLFWYSPALLLAIPGAVWFWRHARRTLAFALILFATYVLFYGKWYMWHGGYSWGPRFMVPTLPFLALLAGPALDKWLVRSSAGIIGRITVALLLVISVTVQWLGMLVPFRLVQDWLDAEVQPLFSPETFSRIDLSPLVLQWQFLQPEHIHLAWYNEAEGITAHWTLLILLAFALGAIAFMLYRRIRQPVSIVEGGRQWVFGVIVLLVTTVLLIHYYNTLTIPELRRAAARIDQLEQRTDAILHVAPEQTQQFSNVYHGRLPVYGVAHRNDMDADVEQWLTRIQSQHQRIFVLPDDTLPEESAWERTLRFEDFLLMDTRMSTPDGQRLALYSVTDQQDLEQVGIGTIFGDPADIDSGIDATNGWIRLQGYSMLSETSPGGELLLQLHWKSLQQVDDNYHVFVHLLNTENEKLAQRDGQPVQWMRPTSTWQPDEDIDDRYGLLLPDDLPAGEYTIAVGLYDPVSGQRLPVSAGPRDYAIELGPVTVVAAE